MPRRPRLILPNIPLHIIQRGNNRQPCFFADEDYQSYLEWLEEYAHDSGCAVHAYVLMTNHVHLLLTPSGLNSAGLLMKRLGQRYVQYVNRTYKRSGTLWEGRFRSCIVEEDNYFLLCHRYIELNPVRAEIVDHPGEYRWSSFGANGQGDQSDLLTPHFNYKSLGQTDEQRQMAYRELFRQQLDLGIIDEIRSNTNGNFALGNNRFKAQIAEVLGRRVAPGAPGRPSKNPAKP
jgi:putative transposase